MRNKWLWLCCVALALSACDKGQSFSIAVVFPDDEARAQARQVNIFALEPAVESTCAALLNDGARPGQPGYEVEGELTFPADFTGQIDPLQSIGPGRRLFLAEVSDESSAVFLRGCTELVAGGKGPGRVTIALARVELCLPSNGGVETCDNLDNDCDGQTDDGDPLFLCPQALHALASGCTDGVCSYTCQGNWIDANGDLSDGCECLPTRDGAEWCDGLDNDCNGQIDGDGCRACAVDADCEHPQSCLGGSCQDGVCQVSYSSDDSPCDDGSVCTSQDACLGGICQGQEISCDDGDSCTFDLCDPVQGCTHEYNTAGCDDGDPCTLDDMCDGAGTCRGTARVCDQPPADTCLNDSQVTHFDSLGTCQQADGQCAYTHQSEDCDFGCVAGACRSSACQGQTAGTDCDDSSVCTLQDSCDDDGVCRGNPLDCDDSNPCTDDSCDPQSGCVNAYNQNPCEDDDPCTVGDACLHGLCQGQAKDCDDSLDCTTDSCAGDGSCAHEIDGGTCLIEGVCYGDGDSPAGSACRHCMPSLAQEQWAISFGADCSDGLFCNGNESCGVTGECESSGSPCTQVCMQTCDEAAGACTPDIIFTACSDSFDCTSDVCDGSGTCISWPDHELCPDGQHCLPECAVDASGCVLPPQLTVECPDGSITGSASCTVSTNGTTGQLDCLTCRALIGRETIDETDFTLDGQAGLCDLDGWLVDDSPCRLSTALPNCPFSGGANCCQAYTCPVTSGPWTGREALQLDGGACAQEQWRIYRSFELFPFAQAQTCFDFMWNGTVDGAFELMVDNGNQSQGFDVLECMLEENYVSGEETRRCYDLPPQWLTIPQTRVLYWFDSTGPGSSWYLDNPVLHAWWPECLPGQGLLFADDFSACGGSLPLDYNGWTITSSGQVNCGSEPCSPDMLRVSQGSSVTMSRIVNLGGASVPLELCWLMGGKTNGEVYVQIDYDIGGGPIMAYYYYGPPTGDDDSCSRQCIDLSAIDPSIVNHASMELTILVQAIDERTSLDNIELLGAARCDAVDAGVMSAGSLTQTADDTFQVDVSNTDGRPFTVELECGWLEDVVDIKDSDSIHFSSP